MISGLHYLSQFVTPSEEQTLLKTIDAQIWQTTLKRRVQHYGYVYDYRRRTVGESMRLGGLPDWLGELAQRMHRDGWIDRIPDQVIINEYLPGQGISLHVDCEPCFGDTILSLSLGSDCVMDFRHRESAETRYQLLEARSLLMMTGEARYGWKHGIAARFIDYVGERSIERSRRVSLTLRNVIVSQTAQ